ncbi:MAG: agmatinase family protein [Candidatus Thermoplasmatota archaeon]
MAFQPSPATYPALRKSPSDPRLLELQSSGAKADVLLCGLPFDGAVLGRKGAAGGPTAIREAFRFLATHDPERGIDLASLRWHDLGDVAGLDANDTLATHETVRANLKGVFAKEKPLVVLGGDNSQSFPVVQALAQSRKLKKGKLGLVVLDAHYDVRTYEGQPSSGTPYGRILTELAGQPVLAVNVAEVGIRPFANTKQLAERAAILGLKPVTMAEVRAKGAAASAKAALARARKGTDRLWLSVDLDVLDQSIAPGVSAPGIGGMTLPEAAEFVHRIAADPRCAGMDLVECAPNLDATGNTARTAAYLVAVFMGGVASRA